MRYAYFLQVQALLQIAIVVAYGSEDGPLANNSVSLDDWQPPLELTQRYIYYVSGFDYESRPVFVCEFGKWDVRRIFDNKEDLEPMRKYMEQAFYRLFNVTYGGGSDAAEGIVIILDLDNFNFRQVASTETLRYFFELSRKIARYEKHLAYGFFINLNYIAERTLELAKPYLGKIMERIEVYGTNPGSWIPRLLRQIPQEQLPPWYGGKESFKPLRAYG